MRNRLIVKDADQVVMVFSAATDYYLSLMNFDRSINPDVKTRDVVTKAVNKSWKELKDNLQYHYHKLV